MFEYDLSEIRKMVSLRRIFVAVLILQLIFAAPSFLLVISHSSFGIPPAHAASGVPPILAFQGRLANANSLLLSGLYYFKFSLYDTVTGGTRVWPSAAPSSASSTVTDGVFNVNIGDTGAGYPTTLTYDFQTSQDVFLQVEVSEDNTSFETMSPRQRITSAPYAMNSGTVLGFTPSQNASGSNIPVLTSGNLNLTGTNPQINTTSTNTLRFQGGAGTGDIQFFSSSNKIT